MDIKKIIIPCLSERDINSNNSIIKYHKKLIIKITNDVSNETFIKSSFTLHYILDEDIAQPHFDVFNSFISDYYKKYNYLVNLSLVKTKVFYKARTFLYILSITCSKHPLSEDSIDKVFK